jgi:hypothetical protein
MGRGGQRGPDEAVSLGELEELLDALAVGQRLQLDVEPSSRFDERVPAVLVSLRHYAVGLRNALHLDAPSLGVELQARERTTGEPGEHEMLGAPIRLTAGRLAEALRDGEFEPFRVYPGQRVITTFFSV